MFQRESAPQTKSNTVGRVTVRRVVPERSKRTNDAPNPRHKEDFDRLLGGMAKSSE